MSTLKRVRKRLADGSTRDYWYHTASGKRVLPPEDPGHEDSVRAAVASMAGEEFRSGTVGALIAEYKNSQQWRALKPSSQRSYHSAIEQLQQIATMPLASLKRRHVLAMMDRLAHKPGAADNVARFTRLLLSFAIDREYIDYNPALRIKRMSKGHHKRWTDGAVAYALEHLPEYLRRALVLALHTGQRQGDCVAMRWSDYDGAMIRVAQEKAGEHVEPIWIPAHEALRAELAAWDRTALTMLTGAKGRPWAHANSLAVTWTRECAKHAELSGLTFHGLRKTAAARLAEAGCTAHEIAAITGHQTLGMVELYTREADRKRSATAAILKLEKMR